MNDFVFTWNGSKQQWRLMNPESDGPSVIKLQGRNVIDGFNKKGYPTIGSEEYLGLTNKSQHI